MPILNWLLSLYSLLCTILLFWIINCFTMLYWLVRSSLIVVMFALVRHMTIHWIHWWHLAELVVLLMECHSWVMVCVRNRNDMLWHLKFTSLTNLIEGLNRNMRHAICWVITHSFRRHVGVMWYLLILILFFLAFFWRFWLGIRLFSITVAWLVILLSLFIFLSSIIILLFIIISWLLLLLFICLFQYRWVFSLVSSLSLLAILTLLTILFISLGHFMHVTTHMLILNHRWMHTWRVEASWHLVRILAKEISVMIRIIIWLHAVHVLKWMIWSCLWASNVALTLGLSSQVHVALMTTLWSKNIWYTTSTTIFTFPQWKISWIPVTWEQCWWI